MPGRSIVQNYRGGVGSLSLRTSASLISAAAEQINCGESSQLKWRISEGARPSRAWTAVFTRLVRLWRSPNQRRRYKKVGNKTRPVSSAEWCNIRENTSLRPKTIANPMIARKSSVAVLSMRSH